MRVDWVTRTTEVFSRMKGNKMSDVRVIIYVTKARSQSKEHLPIPDDFLINEMQMPEALICEMKANGWLDENGTIWWDKKFQPNPALGDDGNIYLAVGTHVNSMKTMLMCVEARKLFS
jgi:hypothetical protein